MMSPTHGPRISIRWTVVSAFVLATVLTAAVAIGLQYYFGRKLAVEATQDIYATAASGLAAKLRGITDKNDDLLELLADSETLLDESSAAERLRSYTELMRRNPLFWAFTSAGETAIFTRWSTWRRA